MARIRYTTYENSWLASLVSILGSVILYGGIMTAVLFLSSGDFDLVILGVILIAAGFGLSSLGGAIAGNKAKKQQAAQQAQQVLQPQQVQKPLPVQPVQQSQPVQPAQPVQPVQQPQPVQPVQQPQPVQPVISSAEPTYEEWWAGITSTISVSQMASDCNIMNTVFNACPKPDYRIKLYNFFRMLAPYTLSQLGWTCPNCGTRNEVGKNCKCGNLFIW